MYVWTAILTPPCTWSCIVHTNANVVLTNTAIPAESLITVHVYAKATIHASQHTYLRKRVCMHATKSATHAYALGVNYVRNKYYILDSPSSFSLFSIERTRPPTFVENISCSIIQLRKCIGLTSLQSSFGVRDHYQLQLSRPVTRPCTYRHRYRPLIRLCSIATLTVRVDRSPNPTQYITMHCARTNTSGSA